jgi:hypothetical protein
MRLQKLWNRSFLPKSNHLGKNLHSFSNFVQTRTHLPLTPFSPFASMNLLERSPLRSRPKLKSGVFVLRFREGK